MSITAEKAKAIMDSQEGYIVLDVRTQEEYDEGHIPNSILIPNTEVCCYFGIAVARNPERYSDRVRRLFYKDGYLHGYKSTNGE